MKVVVDRKEGTLLVLSLPDGECINVSGKICPEAKEGDIINIEILADETKQRKMSLGEKLKKLKKHNI
ncbi:MAG: DUF3006 domain-containing protein [Clostridia bacterium]|nr:DUF3006 domain-containing protein [Clostridia bacterium]